MPSNVIAFSRIEKNKENKTGKHYTKDELQKREKAEKSLRRKSVKLTAPAWLKTENKKPAYAIWKELLKQSADIGLFDDVDAGCLAVYCDLRAQYDEATSTRYPNPKKIDQLSKSILNYAEKLGLTPTARARLVVKRSAPEENNDTGELFE